MKRNARVVAVNEHGDMIEVTVKFRSNGDSLSPEEVKKATREAARMIADGIRNLPYTEFGPENTKVIV